MLTFSVVHCAVTAVTLGLLKTVRSPATNVLSQNQNQSQSHAAIKTDTAQRGLEVAFARAAIQDTSHL